MSSACCAGLGLRPRPPASDCVLGGVLRSIRTPRGVDDEEALHLGVEVRRDEGALEEGVHPRRGWWGTHPEKEGWGVPPCRHTVRFLPGEARPGGRDSCQRGGARVFSFLPVKGQGKDVMPLQLRELRL